MKDGSKKTLKKPVVSNVKEKSMGKKGSVSKGLEADFIKRYDSKSFDILELLNDLEKSALEASMYDYRAWLAKRGLLIKHVHAAIKDNEALGDRLERILMLCDSNFESVSMRRENAHALSFSSKILALHSSRYKELLREKLSWEQSNGIEGLQVIVRKPELDL